MSNPDDPLLVVVGGPTGAGKSTLVNSVLGQVVSDVAVLRPTTRVPVLVHHPADRAAVGELRLPEPLRRVSHDACPPGVVLVDSPDLDSVELANGAVARALLDMADVWVVVTSPSRYADRTLWQELRRASHRRQATAVVLSRVTPETADVVTTDLARLLTRLGLGDAPVTVVPEHETTGPLLPASSVADVHALLRGLSERPEAREAIRSTRAAAS